MMWSSCLKYLSTRYWCLQGANRQGIKEHIKVKQKLNAMGVGAVSMHVIADIKCFIV